MKFSACAAIALLVSSSTLNAQQAAAPATQSSPVAAPTSISAVTPATQSATPPAAPTTPPPPNTLLDGTPVKVRLAENLSSETNKTGDHVAFEVTEEVLVSGVVVIPKGSSALATITNAEPKRRMGRGGKLDVNVDSVRLADGEKAQLRAVKENKGGGHVGAMTGAMVATSIVFFPAAPLFLFMHGKSVDIPKGTEVTAFVEGDMHLSMANFTPGSAAGAPPSGDAAAATAPAPPAMASLVVESTVAGADIEVDGEFVGNAPSTLSVTPGKHTIVVKKKGYADWTRTMTVQGSSVKLNAELEAKP